MTQNFATAMRRALEKTCASDPGAATAIIQAALAGRPETEPANDGGARDPCRGALRDMPAGKSVAGALRPRRTGTAGRGIMQRLPDLHGPAGSPGLSRPARKAPLPDGARVEMRRHAGPAGARDYRLFLPSPRAEPLAGLVVMLHGCTQSPEDFALGTAMDLAAEEAGFAVAYPSQTGQHNPQGCWNWFRPQDQGRAGGEPAILAGLTRALAAELGLTRQVFAAGLSAGGAMAAVLAETHPDVFAAVGIHSGLPAGCASDVPSAFASMRGQGGRGRALTVPAIVFHGTADRTVSPTNARDLIPADGVKTRHVGGGRSWSRLTTSTGSELWLVDGAGHAWFGGDGRGSYADPAGPDASAEMLRFFNQTRDRL